MTVFVLVTCIVGASGGLLFGYDLGTTGGLAFVSEFLDEFFPSVHMRNAVIVKDKDYCKFDNKLLTTYISSVYLFALVASIIASAVTRTAGRKISMLIGGSVYLAGSIFNSLAQNMVMLIMGRILIGVGVGFANQSVPVYLSEIAPAKLRGALNTGFSVAITIGVLVAQFVNYRTAQMKSNGWRWAFGCAAVPAMIMTAGALVLPDTPNSLLLRGHVEEAKVMLAKLRGTTDVDEEFIDLMEATEETERVENPWKNIFRRRYRPYLVMAIMIPIFQQLTGIFLVFYVPVLFQTWGLGVNTMLVNGFSYGVVNVVANLVAIVSVDKCGRRFLFLEGGVQMIVCQILIGMIVGMMFGINGEGTLSKGYSNLLDILIGLYMAGFSWSWGPLTLLVASEIFPLEVRSAGQATCVSVSMLFSFFISQNFLSMLCQMKFGLFFFFAAWEVIMTVFIYSLFPETKNVPIEEMSMVWKQHWYWGKYIHDEAIIGNFQLPVGASPK